MKIVTASGIFSFNCLAPWTSMSSTRSLPLRPGLLQDAAVGPVIVAENLGPFQKFAAGRASPRTPPGRRNVALAVVSVPRGLASGVGNREHQAWNVGQQPRTSVDLPEPEGAEMMKTVVIFETQNAYEYKRDSTMQLFSLA